MSTEGNKLAAALYNEHRKWLQQKVRKYVPDGDASRAEDVVQETFARTVKHLNNGKTLERPRGFLFTTARNLITSMFYRSRHYTETDDTLDMDQFATEANTCSPERWAMMQQRLDAFSIAIETIPTNYREAFVRRRVWGQSCREIGEIMGVKEHTIATYVGYAWQSLKDYCEANDIPLDDFSDDKSR